ncbi:MAG: TIGR00730 family Rossman fold protein, partial [Planctomycetaceae bacterium]|nr:TIGR00730 family Rossman fold protein [Planctomycetaceae bacterium]
SVCAPHGNTGEMLSRSESRHYFHSLSSPDFAIVHHSQLLQRMVMGSICVFCGSRTGRLPLYAETAAEFGRFLASAGHTLVYGGGSTGIMGVLADTVLAENGHVIGVITEHLARPELMHAGVADMRIMRDMHERKSCMHELAALYVALPGGYGTLEELFEAVTWAQLELHSTPVALLNTGGIYDGVIQVLNTMADEQFLTGDCRRLMHVFADVPQLVAWIQSRLA